MTEELVFLFEEDLRETTSRKFVVLMSETVEIDPGSVVVGAARQLKPKRRKTVSIVEGGMMGRWMKLSARKGRFGFYFSFI